MGYLVLGQAKPLPWKGCNQPREEQQWQSKTQLPHSMYHTFSVSSWLQALGGRLRPFLRQQSCSSSAAQHTRANPLNTRRPSEGHPELSQDISGPHKHFWFTLPTAPKEVTGKQIQATPSRRCPPIPHGGGGRESEGLIYDFRWYSEKRDTALRLSPGDTATGGLSPVDSEPAWPAHHLPGDSLC